MRLGSILVLLAILIALAVYFFAFRPAEPDAPLLEPIRFVWSIDMDELQRIVIKLPGEGKSEAFIKHVDRQFYFDVPDGPVVNPERWGGGIPLLLEGPGAERRIAKDATEEKLAEFGFAQPQMEIMLTLDNEDTVNIEVGSSTPDGHAYYVKLVDSNNVYTVDAAWYDVLERLVTEPPYPTTEPD